MARNQNTQQQQQAPKAREENELVDKLVGINRVAKVVKGGRRFAFSAMVVVGDQRGRVGYGKRNMIRVPLREGRTLHHDVQGHFGAGRVILRSAPAGTGIIAGGAMRAVFETMGVQDVVSKCTGSNNPHNVIRATLDALVNGASPRQVAAKRGLKVGEIVARRDSGSAAAAVLEKE
jgi:small subunit ribosomal protein S5